MPYEAIDHLSQVPSNPEQTAGALAKIGWNTVACPEGTAVSFGGPANLFQIWNRSAEKASDGAIEIGIRVTGLAALTEQLRGRGLASQTATWRDESGNAIAEVAHLDTLATAGVGLRLVEWHIPTQDRIGVANASVKRMDHLALITHDLEAKSAIWENVLGIPRFGEITTAALVIRQYKIGDAIVELLGPANAESMLWQRAPGPAPMFSVEVADLDQLVAFAQSVGFTAPAAAIGALPGTRTSTIPLGETGGLNWQLLDYV